MMYFSFLLWASTIAAIQSGLCSSNVLCFIAIVAIESFFKHSTWKNIEL